MRIRRHPGKFSRFLLKTAVCLSLMPFASFLPGQSSRVELEVFGLASHPLRNISTATHHFNVFRDFWDSYQQTMFSRGTLQPGFGAGLTYWINNGLGLRVQAFNWKKRQGSSDNNVLIQYEYIPYPWWMDPPPVRVSYGLKSEIPPELSTKIGALAVGAILRNTFGGIKIDFSAGLTVAQLGGGFRDLYLKRTIEMSRGTFMSESVTFDTRFDMVTLGGNVGMEMAVPLGAHVDGFLGWTYFFGGSREPEMFISSVSGQSDDILSHVLNGVEEARDRVRLEGLSIGPSAHVLNMGLKYRPAHSLPAWDGQGRLRLMISSGASRKNPEWSHQRTVLTAENESRILTQDVNLFNKRILYGAGGGGSFRFSRNWELGLDYQRHGRDLDVDSGLSVLRVNGAPSSPIVNQRPQSRLGLHEWRFSLQRVIPTAGLELLVSAGVILAGIDVSISDIYFLYWHEPWTSGFVSFSGLYSTRGRCWVPGADIGLGLRFPLLGPLEGKIGAGYSLFPETRLDMNIESIAIGQVSGIGGKTHLELEELNSRISPVEFPLNLSRFRLTASLAVRI